MQEVNLSFRCEPKTRERLENVRQQIRNENPDAAHLLTLSEVIRVVVARGLNATEGKNKVE